MENNRYITVTYNLLATREGVEKLMEQATEEQPMTFISGIGQALKSFEDKLISLETGSDFDFTLQPEEAFGNYDDQQILTLPKSMFLLNGHFDGEHIHPEAIVPLQDEQGRKFLGQVLEVDSDNVRMDLNHPLAGRVLRFVGHVVENREATDDELKQSQQHHHCHHGGKCGHHGHGECNGEGHGECKGGCEGNCECGNCN